MTKETKANETPKNPEVTQEPEVNAKASAVKEREEEFLLLKERADLMGISYSKNVSLELLRARVNAKLEESNLKAEETQEKVDVRKQIQKEQLRLVRVRLTCMNPDKKAWRGEIFTIANSVIGTVKKFVPYDPKFYANGYHIPYCIYNHLKDKTYMDIKTHDTGSRVEVTTSFPLEYSIEVLPALTKEELAELATAQMAGNRIDPESN